jgi:PPE-repeat protein
LGSSLGTGAGSQKNTAKKKAPEPDSAAAAAGVSRAIAGVQARARRRRRATLRGYAHEFMDMDVQVEPDWGAAEMVPVRSTPASGQGAGTMGFAGTTRGDTAVEALGLAALAGDGFGGGPTEPMVPGTWTR